MQNSNKSFLDKNTVDSSYFPGSFLACLELLYAKKISATEKKILVSDLKERRGKVRGKTRNKEIKPVYS